MEKKKHSLLKCIPWAILHTTSRFPESEQLGELMKVLNHKISVPHSKFHMHDEVIVADKQISTPFDGFAEEAEYWIFLPLGS